MPDDLDLTGLDDPAPPVPANRHRAEVARRSTRIVSRRRALRRSVVVAVVVVASLGVAVGTGQLGGSPRHATATGPAPVPTTGTPSPAPAANDQAPTPSAAGATSSSLAFSGADNATGAPVFGVTGCPPDRGRPTTGPWSGCGPVAPAGDGHGPGGRCDGTEPSPPCAGGVVTGRAYAVSLPTGCATGVVFDGHRWDAVADLPGTTGGTVDAWMRLVGPGRTESTGPSGTVRWVPATAAGPACRP